MASPFVFFSLFWFGAALRVERQLFGQDDSSVFRSTFAGGRRSAYNAARGQAVMPLGRTLYHALWRSTIQSVLRSAGPTANKPETAQRVLDHVFSLNELSPNGIAMRAPLHRQANKSAAIDHEDGNSEIRYTSLCHLLFPVTTYLSSHPGSCQ